ncbi:DUF1643 domain-containing protein [Pseudomonas aeruginosa]|uniref:DUF1643 domain-containing protein n=1 Tax=Pseudomonas aeruginosa TaxID=287 RepID=UPI004046DAA7
MSAIISECGQYRYLLTRPGDCLADKGTAVFLMLNPSTADAALDDPTIHGGRGSVRRWQRESGTVDVPNPPSEKPTFGAPFR